MLRRLAIVLAMTAAVFLSACNTVEGAGEDIKTVGDGISDAAESTSEK